MRFQTTTTQVSNQGVPTLNGTQNPLQVNTTGILWLENIFPYRHPLVDPRAGWIERYSGKYMLNQRYEQYIPPEFKESNDFKIKSAQQNLKEGGIYLRFEYKTGNIKEAVEKIQKHVKEVNNPLFFDFLKVKAYQVKGTPFVEDLVSRVPTNRLHVQFLGPDLTMEDLYQEFRVFGRIMDIAFQPSTDKEVPRYASVHFLHKRSATSARNCIHGEKFGDTRLLIGYEKTSHWWQRFANWFNKNTRLAALFILAAVASASYAIFDPWREFSIRNHITGRFNTEQYTRSAYRLLDTAKALIDRFVGTSLFVRESKQSIVLQDWGTRKEMQVDLENNIKQAPNYPILVYGPRGSGKTRFVKEASQKSKYQLYLNCEDLVGKGDNYLIRSLAAQVNFFPTFSFLGQLGGIFDALITATTGAKSNMATTIEGEVKKILECVTLSLESITEAQNQLKSKILNTAITGDGSEIAQSDVEYPVVVIDGFLSKEYSNESYIYQHLVDWAAQLAGIIF